MVLVVYSQHREIKTSCQNLHFTKMIYCAIEIELGNFDNSICNIMEMQMVTSIT